jgi:hypothetical protein
MGNQKVFLHESGVWPTFLADLGSLFLQIPGGFLCIGLLQDQQRHDLRP